MTTDAPRALSGTILIAAAITLAVTLLRLTGELAGWDPRFFGTGAGGDSSAVGITWLVPVVGLWIGRRLAQRGRRPRSTAMAFALPLVGFGCCMGLFMVLQDRITDLRLFALALGLGASVLGLLALVAWPSCWLAMALYGCLARLPVAAIQYFAVHRWPETHFAKGPPGASPEDALFILTTAQLSLWPFAYTTLVGGFFAAIGSLTVRRAD